MYIYQVMKLAVEMIVTFKIETDAQSFYKFIDLILSMKILHPIKVIELIFICQINTTN